MDILYSIDSHFNLCSVFIFLYCQTLAFYAKKYNKNYKNNDKNDVNTKKKIIQLILLMIIMSLSMYEKRLMNIILSGLWYPIGMIICFTPGVFRRLYEIATDINGNDDKLGDSDVESPFVIVLLDITFQFIYGSIVSLICLLNLSPNSNYNQTKTKTKNWNKISYKQASQKENDCDIDIGNENVTFVIEDQHL